MHEQGCMHESLSAAANASPRTTQSEPHPRPCTSSKIPRASGRRQNACEMVPPPQCPRCNFDGRARHQATIRSQKQAGNCCGFGQAVQQRQVWQHAARRALVEGMGCTVERMHGGNVHRAARAHSRAAIVRARMAQERVRTCAAQMMMFCAWKSSVSGRPRATSRRPCRMNSLYTARAHMPAMGGGRPALLMSAQCTSRLIALLRKSGRSHAVPAAAAAPCRGASEGQLGAAALGVPAESLGTSAAPPPAGTLLAAATTSYVSNEEMRWMWNIMSVSSTM
jgi:hypothetical protein